MHLTSIVPLTARPHHKQQADGAASACCWRLRCRPDSVLPQGEGAAHALRRLSLTGAQQPINENPPTDKIFSKRAVVWSH